MNIYKLFLFVVVFTFASCKKDEVIKTEVIDYWSEVDRIDNADRIVNIDVSENAKSALNYLVSPVFVQCPCDFGNKKLYQEYKLDFYFNITNEKKDLIIIKNWNRSDCGFINSSVVKEVTKYTIPIEKIDLVEKLNDFPSTYIATAPNHSTVSITMDYQAKLIEHEYVNSRFPFEDVGNQSQNKIDINSYNVEQVQLEMYNYQAENFVKAINNLKMEFKN